MKHGTINSTTLTKLKNEALQNIEANRAHTHKTYPDKNLSLVDMVYDKQRDAIVDFYFTLLNEV